MHASKAVLVVDDQKSIRALVSDIVSRRGLTVVEAADGFQAMDKARNWKFDLMITDLVMPKLDGIELIRKLRGLQPELRILALSGDDPCCLEAALMLGADETLQKPFDAGALGAAVDRLLVRRA